MSAFVKKMNENIKFNLSPLITNTKYSFESEIIKTLSFFNNKNFRQNFINSSTDKSTLRPQSDKNKLYINKTTVNKQINNNIKYNYRSIDNILKDNNNYINQFNNKRNSIKPKRPSNLSINISNNINNCYYNYSNNLFNEKIIEKF